MMMDGRSHLGLESIHWVLPLEVSHEMREVDDSINRHRIVHGDSYRWVGYMSLDLDDASLRCLGHKFLFQSLVSASDSEDGIDSAPVRLVRDLRLVVAVARVD